jgi:hypothetical protein
MPQPCCSTSRMKYHAPSPPLRVNNVTAIAAVVREPTSRSTTHQSKGGSAIARSHVAMISDCVSVAPDTVNSAPKKSARKWYRNPSPVAIGSCISRLSP